MTTAATSLLGLALPVTGELSGTWGDTVNTSITALLDSAVAGTTTLSADADVTLTTTTLAANQAREAVILWTAGGTVTRYITAPAQSKTYVVLNKTSSTQSIVIRGVGPTTGVTVLAGKQALVAWDGTDFVEISSGYVDGPASSTDNAVARFDGTDGKTIQNSVVIIADTTGNMSGVGTLGVGAITTSGALVGAVSQDAFNTVSTTLNLGGAATTVNIGAATGTLTVANATLAAKAVTATSITNSGLTATRVVYSTTGGLETDSANMTFNGTVLTSSFAGPVAATTLSASSTVSGTGFSTYLASPPAIGGTAAAAGAFTTLSASSTVSGTGFSTYLASPPAIGGTAAAAITGTTITANTGFAGPLNGTVGATTANTGAFTTLTTSSTVTISGGTANGVAYLDGSKVLTTGSALTFDGTNLGLGNGTANNAFLMNGGATGAAILGQRVAVNKWLLGDTATALGSGTGFITYVYGDNPSITYINGSEQMRLTSTGLGIGTSSPAQKLEIAGNTKLLNYGKLQLANGINTTKWSIWDESVTGNDNLQFDSSSVTGVLVLTQSGNLGLGVTPSAWYTAGNFKNFDIGAAGAISGRNTGIGIYSNAYLNSSVAPIYKTTASAQSYVMAADTGQHIWAIAPSGTAGNAITFTQAMTLDASGNLMVGTTTAAGKVTFAGSGLASQTLTLNGTTTGANFARITSSGADGVLGIESSAGSAILSGSSANATVLYTVGATPLQFGTNSATRVTLTATGLVGIGTDAPATNLEVRNASGSSTVLISNSTTRYGYIQWENSGSSLRVGTDGAFPIRFDTNTNERMRIDSSGNLAVGRTSAIGGARVSAETATGSPTYAAYLPTTGTETAFLFVNPNGTVGSITTNGSATLYNVTSDQRLKENIQDAAPASALIDSLQVRQYDWNADGSHQRYGFVAQELVTVAPEAVHQPADPEEMMAVDYSKLVPMLVKEIQDLRKRLAAAGI